MSDSPTKEYYLTVEVRLKVRADTEKQARFKLIAYLAAADIDFGRDDVEFIGQDITCCETNETSPE